MWIFPMLKTQDFATLTLPKFSLFQCVSWRTSTGQWKTGTVVGMCFFDSEIIASAEIEAGWQFYVKCDRRGSDDNAFNLDDSPSIVVLAESMLEAIPRFATAMMSTAMA